MLSDGAEFGALSGARSPHVVGLSELQVFIGAISLSHLD